MRRRHQLVQAVAGAAAAAVGAAAAVALGAGAPPAAPAAAVAAAAAEAAAAAGHLHAGVGDSQGSEWVAEVVEEQEWAAAETPRETPASDSCCGEGAAARRRYL